MANLHKSILQLALSLGLPDLDFLSQLAQPILLQLLLMRAIQGQLLLCLPLQLVHSP